MDYLDYKIHGATTDLLSVFLDPGESIYVETGSLVSMDHDVFLSATMGDGSDRKRNIFSKFIRIFKRKFAGVEMFLSKLENRGTKKAEVVLTPGLTGSQILPVPLGQGDDEIYVNKGYFLGAGENVAVTASMKFKPVASFVGSGELILNKLSGRGTAFVKSMGPMYVKELKVGEKIKVDENSLIGMTKEINYSIHFIKGNATRFFAKEGFILYEVSGPGSVILQAYKKPEIQRN